MAYGDPIRTKNATPEQIASLLEGLLISTGNTHESGAAVSTTSTSYVAYRTTNVSITTNAGEKVLVVGYLLASHSAVNGKVSLTIMEDGVDTTYFGAQRAYRSDTGGEDIIIPFAYLFTPASAGAHTYSLRWKTDTGTAYSTRGGISAIAVQNS